MPQNIESLFPIICPCCGLPVSYDQWKKEMQKALDSGNVQALRELGDMIKAPEPRRE